MLFLDDHLCARHSAHLTVTKDLLVSMESIVSCVRDIAGDIFVIGCPVAILWHANTATAMKNLSFSTRILSSIVLAFAGHFALLKGRRSIVGLPLDPDDTASFYVYGAVEFLVVFSFATLAYLMPLLQEVGSTLPNSPDGVPGGPSSDLELDDRKAG
ncbi:hypothetical protein F4780DRAFT_767732 [Xylariomycetidae sp. FL0641]|nr:hypothetical protein F4780DRAFT_767732 [Xylariomycetidae sp. FL0641]